MYDEMHLKDKRRGIKNVTDSMIIDRCKKYCARMDGVLQDRFDQLFNKDPVTQIPRRWDETVPLDEIFVKAKNECLEILQFTQQITLQPNPSLDLPAIELKLLASDTIEDIENAFCRFADNEYRRAQDQIRRANMIGGGILPSHPITWLAFAYFAKEEIWSLITNPLYLILFLLIATVGTIAYQAHMYGFDVQTIVWGMTNKFVAFVVNQLQQFQEKQMHIQQQGRRRDKGYGMPERDLISTTATGITDEKDNAPDVE